VSAVVKGEILALVFADHIQSSDNSAPHFSVQVSGSVILHPSRLSLIIGRADS